MVAFPPAAQINEKARRKDREMRAHRKGRFLVSRRLYEERI